MNPLAEKACSLLPGGELEFGLRVVVHNGDADEAGIPFLQAGLEGQPLLEGADGCFRGWEEAALLVATLWGISEAPS